MAQATDSRNVFDAIAHEHRQLGGRFEQIRAVLRQKQVNMKAVAELLSDLAQVVERHFAHEEQGGYFCDIVEMSPRLSTDVELLRHQHEVLRCRLRDMCGQVRLAHDSWIWWQALRIDFEGFSQQFAEHEARENSLAQQAYTQDIGPSD